VFHKLAHKVNNIVSFLLPYYLFIIGLFIFIYASFYYLKVTDTDTYNKIERITLLMVCSSVSNLVFTFT